MRVLILGDAEKELVESVRYYDSKEQGLGTRFKDEVVEAVARISHNPDLARLRSKKYRRVNLRGFPHYVAYVVREGTIWILAIAHGHRRPEFWIARE